MPPGVKLPRLTGSDLVRALSKAGFKVTRQRGSHVQLRREESDGSTTTFPVPVHAGKVIRPGTLRGILRLAKMEVFELTKLL